MTKQELFDQGSALHAELLTTMAKLNVAEAALGEIGRNHSHCCFERLCEHVIARQALSEIHQ